jgi:hypothetical protein
MVCFPLKSTQYPEHFGLFQSTEQAVLTAVPKLHAIMAQLPWRYSDFSRAISVSPLQPSLREKNSTGTDTHKK